MQVVFGAGQIGRRLAQRLPGPVRVVRRSAEPIDGVEVVSGDAGDPAFAVRAAAGARTLFHCLNPPYTARAWAESFPRFTAALIEAAVTHDARLVCLENLYPYGPSAEPLTEGSPHRPAGPKGQVRAAVAAALAEAARTRGLRYTIGRAGDFFGPGAEQSAFSMDVVRGIRAGRPAYLLGDPQQPHAFSYVPDVVDALVALGEAPADQVEGRTFHLPVLEVAPAELHRRLCARLGVAPKVRALPRWALRPMSWFVPVLGEVRETLYQWEAPFRVDDSQFRSRFQPSPADPRLPEIGGRTEPRGWTSLDQAVEGAAASPA
ncbi:MAG: NAD-dependent epimerase/dehydratase family protein [Myxococcota bacterium]